MSEDTITVSAPVSFKRWQTPNFASPVRQPRPRQDGFVAVQGVPVAELAPEVLDELARAWLADLYRKVDRSVPRLWE